MQVYSDNIAMTRWLQSTVQGSLDAGRTDRLQYGLGDRLVDLHSSHIQAQGAPPLGQLLAPAMISGRGGPAGVVGRQAATALATGAETLQQGRSFPHCPLARAVRQRPGVAREALENGFVRRPVDIGGMMVEDQHLPLGARQFADARADDAVLVHLALTP